MNLGLDTAIDIAIVTRTYISFSCEGSFLMLSYNITTVFANSIACHRMCTRKREGNGGRKKRTVKRRRRRRRRRIWRRRRRWWRSYYKNVPILTIKVM